jgi:hypothetical protein
MIAVSCGSPTPVTTRVVQIEPRPTPTFTASTPRSTSAFGALDGADVAADDLHVREALAHALDGLQDALGVAVRGVDHQHVDAGVDEERGPLEVGTSTRPPPRPPAAARARPCTRAGTAGA